MTQQLERNFFQLWEIQGAETMAPESATLTQTNPFPGQITVEQVEAGTPLVPKFDADDLIPCVATNATNNHVLMLGWIHKPESTGANSRGPGIALLEPEPSIFVASRRKQWPRPRNRLDAHPRLSGLRVASCASRRFMFRLSRGLLFLLLSLYSIRPFEERRITALFRSVY